VIISELDKVHSYKQFLDGSLPPYDIVLLSFLPYFQALGKNNKNNFQQ
jgi:hypothetical protein